MKKAVFLALLLLVCFASVNAADGKKEKKTKGMEVVESASLQDVKGKRFAFLVAVNKYAEEAGEMPNLPCTVNDVKAIRERLLDRGFTKENIWMLTPEESAAFHPTKNNIKRHFNDMLRKVQEGDWVIVYLSGHGTLIKDKPGSYFCPQDVVLLDRENTTVSINGMMKQLSDSPASFRWMIVDVCREESSTKSFSSKKSLQAVSNPPKNVSLIYSCQPDEFSYEGDIGTSQDNKKNSVFAMSLLESFTLMADTDRDGSIRFMEMFKYINKRTNDLASLYHQKQQHPWLKGELTDFVLFRDLKLMEAKKLSQEADKLHHEAYNLYKKEKFKKAKATLEKAKAKIMEALNLYPNNEDFQELADDINNEYNEWMLKSGKIKSDTEFNRKLEDLRRDVQQKLSEYNKILREYLPTSNKAKEAYNVIQDSMAVYFASIESRIENMDNQISKYEEQKKDLMETEGLREESDVVQKLNTDIGKVQDKKKILSALLMGYSSTKRPSQIEDIRKIFCNPKDGMFYIGNTPGERIVKDLDGIEFAFRWCPPGSFMMGSPKSEEGHRNDETLHAVTLTKGFWMLETEVTQEMWMAIMGDNVRQKAQLATSSHDLNLKGDGYTYPMYYVSWDDCQDFCRKLTAKIGVKISLPTEAQWEYACRANTNGAIAGNLYAMAWYYENTSHPVAKKKPNEWGLYDMYGNVQEWCRDWYEEYSDIPEIDPTGPMNGTSRVHRGGNWGAEIRECRSAARGKAAANTRLNKLGFRIAVTVP